VEPTHPLLANIRITPTELTQRLKIVVRGEGGRQRICLSGGLDVATAPKVEHAVERHLPDAIEIVLDLHELSFMDSMGLRAILTCKELCRRDGCAFALTHGPPQVQRLFETCGLLERMPFVEDR